MDKTATGRHVAGANTVSIAGQTHTVSQPAPGLYLVATPIGNLGDITLRALETLAGADLIACEDTRVTRRLLDRYGIHTQLTAYHDRNGSRVRPQILAQLDQGGRIALVSDAGTPLVSDPGFKLVREASAAGHHIVALPGASSILAALVTSALPTDRFVFEGFLPNRSARRKTVLGDLAPIDATLVFFESARRVAATLEDMVDVLGDRDAAVLRELTKKFEEAVRLPLSELADHYRTIPTPKGEIVIVVGPPGEDTKDHQSAEDLLRQALTQMSVREASREVADLLKIPKRDVYALALKLSQDQGDDPE